MRRFGLGVLTAFLIYQGALAADSQTGETAQRPAPDFQEVYDLIRAHLAGITEPELNRDAVEALVSKLSPKVALTGGQEPVEISGGPLVKASNLYDKNIAYLRISRVEEGLAKEVREACQAIGTNELTGIVLDLRYAGGDSYQAAAETADLFTTREKPLLDWGQGLVHSTNKTDAIRQPVAVLVNGKTQRAAEALAAVLREAGVGLLLGSPTAGDAMIAKEYPLKNGQRLRIATASIQVGDHALLSSEGVKPDIAVEVSAPDERAYYADAYRELTRTNAIHMTGLASVSGESTNRVRRPRFNEAELVRERREGFLSEDELAAAAPESEPDKPVVRDPALARALDVLKGLAVVRKTRS